jgi:hypothetical protein
MIVRGMSRRVIVMKARPSGYLMVAPQRITGTGSEPRRGNPKTCLSPENRDSGLASLFLCETCHNAHFKIFKHALKFLCGRARCPMWRGIDGKTRHEQFFYNLLGSY